MCDPVLLSCAPPLHPFDSKAHVPHKSVLKRSRTSLDLSLPTGPQIHLETTGPRRNHWSASVRRSSLPPCGRDAAAGRGVLGKGGDCGTVSVNDARRRRASFSVRVISCVVCTTEEARACQSLVPPPPATWMHAGYRSDRRICPLTQCELHHGGPPIVLPPDRGLSLHHAGARTNTDTRRVVGPALFA